MRRLLVLLVCTAFLGVAGAQTLLKADFEQGMPRGWQVTGGKWQVVADPSQPGNHVLEANGPGTIRFGNAAWRDYRIRARVRIVSSHARAFHVKLGVRVDNGTCYWLNLRSYGPALIRHAGPKDFTELSPVGGFDVAVGAWYRCSLECAGPVLTATVENAANRDQYGSVRVLDDRLSHGRLGFSIVAYDGPVVACFDDIEVTQVAPVHMSATPGVDYRIRSPLLEVGLESATGALQFTDRRNGDVWRQATAGVPLVLPTDVQVNPAATAMTYRLGLAAGPVEVTVAAKGSEAVVSLKPLGRGRPVDVAYPLPQLPDPGDELVLPTDEGALLPVTEVGLRSLVGNYQYGQAGIIMPWVGLQRGTAGIMALVETSDDFRLDIRQARSKDTPVTSPGIEWYPSRDDLRYTRRIRYCLFDTGGYVSMARRYRKWLQDAGKFRTIAQKARRIPAVARLVGAVDVYDQSRSTKFLQWMLDHRIPRALYSPSDPACIALAKKAGYVTSRYDIYTDIAGPKLLALWGPPKSDLDYRRIGYPGQCIIMRNGKPMPGFAYPVGAKGGVDSAGKKGKRIQCYKRCSATELAWMKKIIPPQIKKFGYDGRFIDVETATGFFECYSPVHPETRTQDREAKLKLFDYLTSLGQVCSSEGGGDWAAAHLDYQEGSLTLNRFAHLPGIYVGTKAFALPASYVRNELDPAIRVPLHELVYHDSTWMTWRWNHTPNRWQQRKYWEDWDLLHILYGAMPIYVVNARYLPERGARLLESMRAIGGVLAQVGGKDMIDHRFLTKDRMVQETVFANHTAVVVNFRHQGSYTLPDGTKLAPRSYRVLHT